MGKTLPLIKANLKGFVRNWKSIIILVILPLLLITAIFASFNPNGIRKINVGYSLADEQTLDEAEVRSALGSFAKLTKYNSVEECAKALRLYREYVCVDVRGSGPFVLEVYYDNTREPVIWEVIQRLEQAIRAVQRQQSKNIASDFLTEFQTAMNKLNAYDAQMSTVSSDIDGYVVRVDQSIIRLRNARNELGSTLDSMDADIASAKASNENARSTKDYYVSSAYSSINVIDDNLRQIPPTPEAMPGVSNARNNVAYARSTIDNMNRNAEQEYSTMRDKITSYEQASRRGRQYTYDLDSGIDDLSVTKQDLRMYQQRISSTKQEMAQIKAEFADLQTLDAETLVNPVVIHNNPTYVPQVDEVTQERLRGNLTDAEAAVKGVSLISLQTIFPTVLILITIFLSLLIGSFVALGEINATAHTRLRTVKNIFFPEFIASFASSLIVVIVPVLVVLIIGNYIFRLGVFNAIFTVTSMLLLLIAIFALLGFLLAYVVRKESMALMISTFVLVLVIFFSGFLLPVERMSPGAAMLAEINPGTLATSMFKQAVFYGSGFAGISAQLAIMIAECIILFFITITVRYFKER